MSSDEVQKPRIHHFVQAPVKPMDVDGVNVAIVGTIVFAIASVVLWTRWDSLVAGDHQWWLWAGMTGTVLGVVGTLYCWNRRSKRTRGELDARQVYSGDA